MRVVDVFAGPGGWSEGLASVTDCYELGVEYEPNACATRTAAGHETLRADVSTLDPARFDGWEGLIASPPCPAFSAAGKGEGREDIPALLEAAHDGTVPVRGWSHPESPLSLEPLRFALGFGPEWCAWEQVPAVLPLWQVCAETLRRHGYSAWAGVLHSEQWGVPQTRTRAFLLASRVGVATPPEPTHQRYTHGQPAEAVHGLFGSLLPWVSMAEALGWPESWATRHETARGSGMSERHGERRVRSASEPSEVVTSKTRSWYVDTGHPTHYDQRQTGAKPRPVTEPAPTMLAEGLAKGVPVWRLNPGATDTQPNRRRYPLDEPAPTVAFGHDAANWCWERPATTIAGDSRCFQPGGHHEPGQQSENAIRLEPHEAAVLQGFRPDYPWQGSRTAQFAQIGNAVPPPWAAALLSQVIPESQREAA